MMNRFILYSFLVLAMAAAGVVPPLPISSAAAGESVDFLSDEFYAYDEDSTEVRDPLEPFNRMIFRFNDKMYIHVMEPVATVYSHVLPLDFRDSIFNFFRNLEEPVRFINTLLQGRFGDSGDVLARFLINSTLGVYGFGDAAARVFNVQPVEATLGETFANWGLGDGFYLVVPFYGSSTLRDFTGTMIDGFAMTPYYAWTDDFYEQAVVYAGKETNTLSMHLGEYEELKGVLFDPYISFRNAYIQYRRKIRNHTPRSMDSPD